MFTRSRTTSSIPKQFMDESSTVKNLLLHSANYSALKKICSPSHLDIIQEINPVTNFQELLDILNRHDVSNGESIVYAPAENAFKKFLYFTGACFPNTYLQEECSLALCLLRFKEEVEIKMADFVESLGHAYKPKMD